MPASRALCCQLDRSHLVPTQESLRPCCSISPSLQTVATGAKMFANGPKRGQKSLSMASRLEVAHRPFPLAGWLMGVFGPIIKPSVLTMFHAR